MSQSKAGWVRENANAFYKSIKINFKETKDSRGDIN